MATDSRPQNSTEAAAEAFKRGWQAIPIADGGKRPYGSNWTHMKWESEKAVTSSFDKWSTEGASGVGLLLGEPSAWLVDVDLDHRRALRLRDYFLPPSQMQTGRAGNRRSHRWYIATGELPSTRRYKMPDGSVSVELRSTGGQTVIPPSIHPSGEAYVWEGEPFGGEVGPARVDGRKLALQVALLGLGSVLIDNWPKEGGRHDAYLALAGGLLRYGNGVHPFWEKNLPVLIANMADATDDDDGPDQRVKETMGTTLSKLRAGGKATGFTTLAEIIGVDHAEQTRRMAREVESLAGFTPTSEPPAERVDHSTGEILQEEDEELTSTLPPAIRNPLEERSNTWEVVDLEPYLAGEIVMPEPTVLQRSDGKGLFYPGRVNSLFGKSEAAKTWISLYACTQEMGKGERVAFLDFEDEPAGTIERLRAMGAGDDDVKTAFMYLHPEEPIKEMMRNRWGGAVENPAADQSSAVFRAALDKADPSLIVVDGMTVIYGLHGLDTNDAAGTDVITSWLKKLTRGGRTTVIVIDHTGKAGGEGSSPIGAHHKTAMVQGASIRADAVSRPMRGAVGTVRLIIHKDRPGAVREYASKDDEQVAGVLTMDSTQPGRTTMTLDPLPAGTFVLGGTDEKEAKLRDLAEAQRIQLSVVELFDDDETKGLTTKEVMQELDLDRKYVYEAWNQLKIMGVIRQEGTTRTTKFYLTGPVDYRLFDDGEPLPETPSAWDRPRSQSIDDYRS